VQRPRRPPGAPACPRAVLAPAARQVRRLLLPAAGAPGGAGAGVVEPGLPEGLLERGGRVTGGVAAAAHDREPRPLRGGRRPGLRLLARVAPRPGGARRDGVP